MKKNQVDSQINRMKNLMSYGLQSENKNIPFVSIESKMEGADGKMYGIVREGANYYIKVAPKKEKLIREDFDYIGGYTHRSENRYESYAKASKDLELKLISLREAHADGKNIIIESWDPKASEKYSQEATEKMRKEILRERKIMENANIIRTKKNATTCPDCDMPGLKDAMSPKTGNEKPETGKGPDKDKVFTDKVGDGDMKDLKEDVDTNAAMSEGDGTANTGSTESAVNTGDTANITEGEDVPDNDDDDEDYDIDDDSEGDDDGRLDRIEDIVNKIAGKLGLDTGEIDTAKYDDDDLFDDDDDEGDDDDFDDDDDFGDDFDDDDEEGDDDDFDDDDEDLKAESRKRKGPHIFESKSHRRAMRENADEYGHHPSFRKQPFTLPKEEIEDKEGYYDMNDDSVKGSKPYATQKGKGTPFTVDIEAIENSIEESVRRILKKKSKRK